jgi:hypothetical protein
MAKLRLYKYFLYACSICLVLWSCSFSFAANNYIAEGIEKIYKGKYRKAIEILQKALDKSPDNREATYYTAKAYFKLGEIEKANNLLKKVIKRRVVVIFQDNIKLPYEDGADKYIDELKVGPWRKLAKNFPGIKMNRVFKSLKPKRIQSLVDRAKKQSPEYKPAHFLGFFVVDCPPGIDQGAVAKALSSWPTVRTAYISSGPIPPPSVTFNDERLSAQGYLEPAPEGIDAKYAWDFAGGDGGGQGSVLQFVDLEQGWTFGHEDLQADPSWLISGLNQEYFGHGTAVLGIVAAVANNNSTGIVGIAHNVPTKRVVSRTRNIINPTTGIPVDGPEDAIMDAIDVLNPGDVLLLEATTIVYDTSGMPYAWDMPLEAEDAIFLTIETATKSDIVVVEAAGNFSNEFDNYSHPGTGNKILNRSSGSFRDSGVIMVGAATSSVPHKIHRWSSFGNRIDCYAWGDSIVTTGDGWEGDFIDKYTNDPDVPAPHGVPPFGGTSGAAAIIAGAALSLQGMVAQANLSNSYPPDQIREILCDKNKGTKIFCDNEENTRTCYSLNFEDWTDIPIGVMPDLKRIIDEVLQLTQDTVPPAPPSIISITPP